VFQLVYRSIATNPPKLSELEELLVTCRMNNDVNELTGLLLYFDTGIADRATFLQVLEGAQENVERVFNHIAADPRHSDIEVIARGEISARRFPEWTMGLEYVTYAQVAAVVPGLATAEHPMVVMAQLLQDPQTAERLIAQHLIQPVA
jgi:hypothetical protein